MAVLLPAGTSVVGVYGHLEEAQRPTVAFDQLKAMLAAHLSPENIPS